jgi:hypothetical protein
MGAKIRVQIKYGLVILAKAIKLLAYYRQQKQTAMIIFTLLSLNFLPSAKQTAMIIFTLLSLSFLPSAKPDGNDHIYLAAVELQPTDTSTIPLASAAIITRIGMKFVLKILALNLTWN